VRDDLSLLPLITMLEQVDTLPGAQRESTLRDRIDSETAFSAARWAGMSSDLRWCRATSWLGRHPLAPACGRTHRGRGARLLAFSWTQSEREVCRRTTSTALLIPRVDEVGHLPREFVDPGPSVRTVKILCMAQGWHTRPLRPAF
jgi:hypothetical protein